MCPAAVERRIEAMLEIGSSLREARSQQGLDYGEVEAAILIRSRYLEAIENEQFELLPVGAYRRSFVREYAEFLGLDGEVYAAEYELRSRPREPEALPPAPRLRRLNWLESVPLTRSLVVIAAIAVLGIAVWLLGGSGNTPKRTQRLSQPARAPRTHQRPSPAPPVSTHSPSNPSEPTHPTLMLTAVRGSCWLLVRVGSSLGPTIYEHTLQPGQSVRFGLRKRLWLRLGAAWNLHAMIGSRDVSAALPASTGNLYATPTGLTPTA
jgi:hypothetical protein